MYTVKLENLTDKDKKFRIANYVFTGLVIIACIATLICHLAVGDPKNRLMSCLLTTFAMVIPYIVEIIFKRRFGNIALLGYSIFVFVSAYIGSATGIFKSDEFFDKICHTSFGYFGCYIGLMLGSHIVNKKEHPWHMAIICFLFVMAGASLWEIFEFSGDVLLGGTAQGTPIDGITPVTDTMLDIVLALLGCTVFQIQYMFHVFLGKDLLIDTFIEDHNTPSRDKGGRTMKLAFTKPKQATKNETKFVEESNENKQKKSDK